MRGTQFVANDEYLINQTYDEITVGQSAELTRVLTRRDIQLFAVMSGDINPAHLDDAFAEQSSFHEVIAHGMWSGSLFSTLLGTQLPGPGTIYLSQQFKFHRPVHVGDTLTIRVECVEKADRHRLRLQCTGLNQDTERVISGEAWVMAPTEHIRRKKSALPSLTFNDGVGALYKKLLADSEALAPLVTAVVHPMDEITLRGALESAGAGLIVPIFVAPKTRLLALAKDLGLSLDAHSIVDVEHSHAAGERAVELVHEGRAEALMKGQLHTDEFLRPIVAKATGLRTERRISHVFAMDVPSYHKPLYLTDCAINLRPDLNDKRDLCQNAIDLFCAITQRPPKVAVLAAVETVDPKMPSTLDATALCKMAERGQIRGALLDGPLAMDNALSKEAAEVKGIVSQVAGDADILLCPDLESGNMLFKQMRYLSGAEGAGIVLGARVPIMLTSRAGSIKTRVCSAAMALIYARHANE